MSSTEQSIENAGGVSISGTPHYIAKFNAAGNNIDDSPLFVNAGKIGFGTVTPLSNFHIVDATSANVFRIDSFTVPNTFSVGPQVGIGIAPNTSAALQVDCTLISSAMGLLVHGVNGRGVLAIEKKTGFMDFGIRNRISTSSGIIANTFDTYNTSTEIRTLLRLSTGFGAPSVVTGQGAALSFAISATTVSDTTYTRIETGKISSVWDDVAVNSSLRFSTYSTTLTEKMRLQGNGYLGLGTTTPLSKFHVDGTVGANTILGTVLDNLGGWTHIITVSGGNGISILESGGSTNALANHRIDITGGSGGIMNFYNNLGVQKIKINGSVGSNRIEALNDAGGGGFEVSANGNIIMYQQVKAGGIQTGNAGLLSGDLYVDSAASILLNGDLVLGRKV